MNILFPLDPTNKRQPDQDMANEYNIAKTIGHNVFLFDFDMASSLDGLASDLRKKDNITTIVYRGWMMNEVQYLFLYNSLLKLNYKLSTTPEQYESIHLFPNFYKDNKHLFSYHISIYNKKVAKDLDEENPFVFREIVNPKTGEIDLSHTPLNRDSKEMFIGNIRPWELMFMSLDKNKNYIIKDYVKSVKTSKGPMKIKGSMTLEKKIGKMIKFKMARGNLFNGGYVFKEIVSLKDYDGFTNEWRFFIKDGKIISKSLNSNYKGKVEEPDDGIATKNINTKSTFFTIDVAEKYDGSWIVLEAGDGQVSGPTPTQNLIQFYNNL